MFDYLSIIPVYIIYFKAICLFILAFGVTYFFIPKIIQLANTKRLFVVPNQRSEVRTIVPTLGGIGIFVGTIITFLTCCFDYEIISEVASIIGISMVFILIGINDDLIGLSSLKKLSIQLSIFVFTTVILHIRILNLNGFFGIYELSYITSVSFTIMFCIIIINSLNLIDGIDGLFGSISFYIAFILGWQFLGNTYKSYSFLNFCLAGSLLAFLLFNIFGRKNKIFAGDTGTLFVGFLLSISAVKSINIDIVPNSRIISLFALPIFDTIMVSGIRIYQGRSPFTPDMNHIYHLLLKKSLSHLQASLILVTYGILCILAVIIIPLEPILILIGLFLVFVSSAYFLSISSLQKTSMERKKEFIQKPKLDLFELHYSLGLKSNPFSRFSAEEEIDYLDDIYYSPKYFLPLFADIKNGYTRFILGARGVGKTALLIKLKKQLDRINVLSIIIDNYDGIPIKSNSKFFLENTIKKVVTGYCFSILSSPILLKRLNKSEKERLTFFIENFFNSITKKEFEEYVNITSNYKSKNFWIRACNYLLKPVNSFLSLGIEIGGDVVKKSFGLDSFNTTMVYKEYLKEIKEFAPNKTLFIENATVSTYKDILCDLSKIIKKSGFEQVVILYDKIDEFKELEGDTKNIADFLSEILTDTNLLLNSEFGLVFSLWNELKEDLSKIKVRFDKIIPIDVTWTNAELEQIINTRLSYFSSKKLATIKLEEIVEESKSLEEIIVLSNKSPRDLLRLISFIYYEQANIDNRSPLLSTLAARKGILKFISDYDYYSIYPQKGFKDDVLKNLKNILFSGKLIFKVSDISQDLNISIPTSNTLIKNLINHGIIQELNQTQGNARLFEIIDPKIVWLIKNQINPWGNRLTTSEKTKSLK